MRKFKPISQMDEAELTDFIKEMEWLRVNRFAGYNPYPKQAAFHAAGLNHRERLFRAGNQNGKTWSGGMEAAYHLTGQYPDWWEGRRFETPITFWAAGVTGESTRDNPQRVLVGPVGEEHGIGTIPRDCILDYAPARGVADLIDYIKVKHISGQASTLRFKFYEQGRAKWQGPPVHCIWFDEEPPTDIYDEGLARTIATKGLVYTTFTPLLGMSEVVRRFLTEMSPARHDTNMTIEDALHIPAAQRAEIIASFPPHEREARAKGIPLLGSGRIYPIEESLITVDPIKLPDYWPRLGAMDFGYDHPFSAVEMAWDRDNDVVYVTRCFRMKEATPMLHAGALRQWGENLPWAWPHDGLRHSQDSGEQLAEQYRKQGLRMMGERATFSDGTNGVEAGLFDILGRMQSGRFKVFNTCGEWFEEFRLYHRKEGKVVKIGDDLMDATRYGIMMLRYARTSEARTKVPVHIGIESYNPHSMTLQ